MTTKAFPDDAPVRPDDELLVAYLDNELSPSQRGGVEDRLIEDDRLRSRLRELQAGWNALDCLPPVSADEKLVESTLELVVSEVVGRSDGGPRDARRPGSVGGDRSWRSVAMGNRSASPARVAVLRWVGLTAALVGLAVLAGALAQRSRFRDDLEALEIAEYLNGYAKGGDHIELMRLLAADPDFVAMLESAEQVGMIAASDESLISQIPADERPQAIAKLGGDERTRLANAWGSFAKMRPEQRDRIRKIHATVGSQPDAASLRRTMVRYAEWREMLPDELVDRIEKPVAGDNAEAAAARRKAVAAAITSVNAELPRRSSKLLSAETVDGINELLRQVVRRRLDQGDPFLSAVHRRLIERADPETAEATLMNIVAGGRVGLRSGRGPEPRAGDESRGGLPRPGDAVPLSDAELWEIDSHLDEKDAAFLDSLDGGIESMRLEILQQWAIEAAATLRPWRTRQTLLERYRRLSDEERDRLDLSEPTEFLQRINRTENLGPRGLERFRLNTPRPSQRSRGVNGPGM